MDILTTNELLKQLTNISNQLSVSNKIAIFDRLLAQGTITDEDYVEELKELLKK